MPGYIGALRSEIKAVLGDNNGIWTVETLNILHHMDSFLKESQRMNASSFRKALGSPGFPVEVVIADIMSVGFDRKVMSTIQLSDGTILHSGDAIAMHSGPMSQDPAYYKNATCFDGDRFYNAPSDEPDATRNSENDYTGIEPGILSWGNGRFSCPGRWYASAMIKLLLAKFILEYDFEFPEGRGRRPKDFIMDVHVLPDMKQKMLVKKRSESIS